MIELGSADFWNRLKQDPELLAAEVCSIDLGDLDTTLQHHPALRAWVNAAYEGAAVEVEQAKWNVGKARAVATLTVKKQKDPDTAKPKTVQVLAAEVDDDENVGQCNIDLWRALEKRGALRAMAHALEDRAQMLIQISAKQRQEAKDYS